MTQAQKGRPRRDIQWFNVNTPRPTTTHATLADPSTPSTVYTKHVKGAHTGARIIVITEVFSFICVLRVASPIPQVVSDNGICLQSLHTPLFNRYLSVISATLPGVVSIPMCIELAHQVSSETSVAVSVSLCVSLAVCLCMCLSVLLFLSVSVSLLCVSLSVRVSGSLYLSVCLCHSDLSVVVSVSIFG